MKRIFCGLLVLLIVFLVSCSTKSENSAINSPQVPENDGDYLLYSVGDEVTFEQLESEGIHIYGINNRSSFNDFIETYPILELEQSPAYLLFDKNGLIYKTYNYDELIQYLKENPQP